MPLELFSCTQIYQILTRDPTFRPEIELELSREKLREKAMMECRRLCEVSEEMTGCEIFSSFYYFAFALNIFFLLRFGQISEVRIW